MAKFELCECRDDECSLRHAGDTCEECSELFQTCECPWVLLAGPRWELRSLKQDLAVKVVNLRRALELANRCLREEGCFALACDEDARPSFRESRVFWAEVRKLINGD